MTAGHSPFTGNRDEVLAARRGPSPAALERQDLPYALRVLVFCLLSPDRERRPASAATVVERLEDIRIARADIDRLLGSDESARLEFKATLRVPIDPPKPGDKRSSAERGKAIEREAIETLAAFLNTDGGTLIIGVKDNREIVGMGPAQPVLVGGVRLAGAQKLHFSAEWSLGFMKIASYGQAAMQALQPMQASLSKWTMPSGRVNIAPVGYAATQGASSHWLQHVTWKARRAWGNAPTSTLLT